MSRFEVIFSRVYRIRDEIISVRRFLLFTVWDALRYAQRKFDQRTGLTWAVQVY